MTEPKPDEHQIRIETGQTLAAALVDAFMAKADAGHNVENSELTEMIVAELRTRRPPPAPAGAG
jgi:predicted transcriptional regulator